MRINAKMLSEKGFRDYDSELIQKEYGLSEEELAEIVKELKKTRQNELVSCLDCRYLKVGHEEDDYNISCKFEEMCNLADTEQLYKNRPYFTPEGPLSMSDGTEKAGYPLMPRRVFEELFHSFFDSLGCDVYGYPDGKSTPGNTREIRVLDSYGYGNDTYEIRPFYWGWEKEPSSIPNFVYRPDNLEIRWYKYPLRGAIANKKITPSELKDILNKCIEST